MKTWIRSPLWDGGWILSGLPLGAALSAAVVWGGVSAHIFLLGGLILFSTAHNLSPIVLAWTHQGFRKHMLERPIKFVAVPLTILLSATLAGYVGSLTLQGVSFNEITGAFSLPGPTLTNLRNPFLAMALLYALWNGYHFGMQNFGVMSIYRRLAAQSVRSGGTYRNRRSTPSACVESEHRGLVARAYAPRWKAGGGNAARTTDLVYCCGMTWAAMLMPFIPRLAHGLHDTTGWPPSPAFIAYVRPAYFALAALAVGAMMWREMRLGTCAPRQILILTDGLAMMLIWFAGLWGFAILALNHWLVAIGLAAHVHANNRRAASTLPFALTLIILGLVVFAVLFIRHAALSTAMLGFTVTAVGARLGLGFDHFLYDRWIYKLSNSQVRATIGKDIFPAPM
jgi:hypothetical protein